MRKIRLIKGLLVALIISICSCVTTDMHKNCTCEKNKDHIYEKLYRTYLVNSSSHYIEYNVFYKNGGIFTHSEVLPPKSECEGLENWSFSWVPWSTPLDIPIGDYIFSIRFRYDLEGAMEPGPWKFYEDSLTEKKITKKDENGNKLIYMWEIVDETININWRIE